jgi:hypothetical protein
MGKPMKEIGNDESFRASLQHIHTATDWLVRVRHCLKNFPDARLEIPATIYRDQCYEFAREQGAGLWGDLALIVCGALFGAVVSRLIGG